MGEVRRINDQLRRAFEGQAWHGPSLIELLSDVTAEQAAAKPVPAAHSIWELVLHIEFWEEVARRRVEGDEARVQDGEGLFTVTDTSEAAWQAAVERLKRTN